MQNVYGYGPFVAIKNTFGFRWTIFDGLNVKRSVKALTT